MSKEENVLKYYAICSKLKHIIRTGWKVWNVQGERLESIAEHVYGVQMLAISMASEYNYDIDIMKVIFMLAIHEIGETVIGDITLFQMPKEDKERIEHEAVHKILDGLIDGDKIEELFLEFDSHSTKEAMFAFQCDKLECDMQAKMYYEEGRVDLNNQKNNNVINDPSVKKYLDNGETWDSMWLHFSQEKYPYDENFKSVSDYALNHKLKKLI